MDVSGIRQGGIPIQKRIPGTQGAPGEGGASSQGIDNDTVVLGSDGPAPKKIWTFMSYSAADNNLLPQMLQDVNEMEAVGSTKNMNIIVQLDRGGDDCKRYYIKKDDDPDNITSPVLKDLGSTNMSDPDVLADFIKFSVSKFPAKHYALIIGDHGDAWKGLAEDESHNGWMSVPDLQKALKKAEDETGKKIDVLGFDACQMASTEVAYEVKDRASFMVASQESEDVAGWSYTPLLSSKTLGLLDDRMNKKLSISPRDLAKRVVKHATNVQNTLPTMSAIDLSRMKEVADASNLLAGQLMLTDTPKDVLRGIIEETQDFDGVKDHYHFAQLIVESGDVQDRQLKKAAQELMGAIKTAVIAEQHRDDYPDCHGLTAEVSNGGELKGEYGKLAFAIHTLWDEGMAPFSP